MSKTALAAGASGFVGREAIRRPASHGWQVLPAVRCPEGLDSRFSGRLTASRGLRDAVADMLLDVKQ